MPKVITQEQFIIKADIVHNQKYEYSEVVYKGTHSKVKIVCFEHGIFFQRPSSHLLGNGCRKCSNLKRSTKTRKTKEKFSTEANLIHNNFYDYSLINYINDSTKIEIICKLHGSFKQSPNNHLRGRGCPKCKISKIVKCLSHTKEFFIEKANLVHGNKYDYSLVEYTRTHTKIKIICNKCEKIFSQEPSAHLFGKGCSFCCGTKKLTTKEFIEKATKIHNDLYDYSQVIYESTDKKVKITCNKCKNYFLQTPYKHLYENGCPYCSNSKHISKPEIEWLKSFNILEQYQQYFIKINNKLYKVDGFCPKTNTIYEFLGDFWHGNINNKKFPPEKIHPRIKKTYGELYQITLDRIKLFEENDYKVVYIWESDYNKQKEKT